MKAKLTLTAILLLAGTTLQAAEFEPLWMNPGVPCSWDLATAPDGSIYCVEPWIPQISKFDSSGNLLSIWETIGPGAGDFLGLRGIAVDSLGKVYAGDDFGSRIIRFSADGNFEALWGNDVLSGTGTPSEFEACFAGQTCYPGIHSFHGAEGFTWPHDVAIDPRDDSVIVADTVANRVVRFDPTTSEFAVLYDWCASEDCQQVLSAEVNEAGDLFVAILPRELAKYVLVNGAYTQAWIRDLGEPSQPTAHYLALDSRSNVYVTNEQAHKVNVFSSDGAFLMAWGWGVSTGTNEFEICTEWPCLDGIPYDHGYSPNLGQFGGPIGIAVDHLDRVTITDNYGRLQQFGSTALLLACAGYMPPMASYPVTVKKNRALPLKAQVIADDGSALIATDLTARPVVQVLYDSGLGGDPVDVTSEALSAGLGTEGNQFEFTDEGHWQFNLLTRNYTAPGTYIVTMESGDDSEYVLDPSCVTEFVVQ
jgi:hypothetical protein